ncbi:MAG TPA: GGDEF domain-containing protein [Terriglobales bacterium]|nr:GGDEF domain-containing protein [Terriglobales bacterium]
MPGPVRREAPRIRKEIESIQGRLFQLMSITILVMIVLATGLALRIVPRMIWLYPRSQTERFYVPQLLCGLVALVGLLSWYVLQQRLHLRETQQRLIQELIRRETAERLAVIDPLTEIYNRRYIMRAIASEVARVDRQNSKFSFLMIDVNGFKAANDSLGHLAGDRILRELSQILQKTLRTSDVISRYGGDEFLVLLIDADEAMATRAVERLQDAVEKWNAAATIENYTMSISCGFATYHKGVDPAAVLAAADQAMYRSKASAEKTASPETSRAASRAVASGN